MKVLIIEDEPFAQNELKRLLNNLEDSFQILNCIDTVEESVEWFEKNDLPDIVFLDIQLSDGISFDIFNQVAVDVPIIFTTAYDEYAIDAFKLNSIDYLLKPVKQDDLKAAIDKLKKLKQTFSKEDQELKIEALLAKYQAKKSKDRFIIKIRDQIKYIKTEEIAYFTADNNIVFLHNIYGNRHIIEYNLEKIQQLVDHSSFFRISRKYIVHLQSIKKISKHLNGRLKLELIPATEDEIYVSRSRVGEFLNWIDQ